MDSKTALVRYMPLPYDVVISVKGTTYTFKNHNGVSLAYIQNEHIGDVMNIKHVCCGGASTNTFRLANEAQVAHWEKFK